MLSTYIYSDTVVAAVPYKLSKAAYREVRAKSGPILYVPVKDSRGNVRCYWMVVHLPTDAALRALEALVPNYVICGIEVATDFVVSSQRKANRVNEWINQRAILPYGRRGTNRDIFATHVWQKGRRSRGLCTYPSELPQASCRGRLSKMCGGYCSHIELRFAGAKWCREKLLLETFSDVIACDFRQIVRDHLKLCELDRVKLLRMLERRLSRQQLARLHRHLDSAQDVKDHVAPYIFKASATPCSLINTMF